MQAERAQLLAATFQALADPTRLQLLSRLLGGEQCVHELAADLLVSQSAVSHQLRLLRDRQLVRTRRAGRHMYYRLDDDHVRDLLGRAIAHLEHA